jgi:hypothetical protein
MKQQIVLALFVAVGMVVDTAARPRRADADQDQERLKGFLSLFDRDVPMDTPTATSEPNLLS